MRLIFDENRYIAVLKYGPLCFRIQVAQPIERKDFSYFLKEDPVDRINYLVFYIFLHVSHHFLLPSILRYAGKSVASDTM